MLRLPSVTLFAVDGVSVPLAVESMVRCASQVSFGDVVLFSPSLHGVELSPLLERCDGGVRWVRTSPLDSLSAYWTYRWSDVPRWLRTDHALCCQWDGFVTNAAAWEAEFLTYDHLGARWPWQPAGQDIGNSGFCLQSTRLLRHLAGLPAPKTHSDDVEIAGLRPALEESGYRFPDGTVADRFSSERAFTAGSFGFHGIFNFPDHLGDDEVLRVLRAAPTTVFQGHSFQLLLDRCDADRPDLAAHLRTVALGVLR